MQATRQRIITILKEKGQATVDELANRVGLTPMAVRHHLNMLQADNLIDSVELRRRHRPGRPTYLYKLSETADMLFPSDDYKLTNYLIDEVTARLGKEEISQIFNEIADRLANEAPSIKEHQHMEEQLTALVNFLHQKGFIVQWESTGGDYLIHVYSCPYRRVAKEHPVVCVIDTHIINKMLNVTPTLVSSLVSSDNHCTYLICKTSST